MKKIVFLITLTLSFYSIAKNNNGNGNGNSGGKNKVTHAKPTLSIIPELVQDYKVSTGEKASFKGKICVLKKHPVKEDKPQCKALEDEGQFAKHTVKFFFPDTNTEVTDKVQIVKSDSGVSYIYESNEIKPEDLNRLTVIVEENDEFSKLLNIEAKLQRHIDLVERLRAKLNNDTFKEKNLAKLQAVFEKIKNKIKDKLHDETSLFARLDYPVQVDNKIMPPVEYFSIVSGLKLWMKIPLGVAIQGERTKILAKVTNLEEGHFYEEYDDSKYKDNQWHYRAEFSLDGSLLYKTEEVALKSNVMFEFEHLTEALSPNDAFKFDIKVFRSKEVPTHAASYNKMQNQGWGNISYDLDIQTDTIAPRWADTTINTDLEYHQSYPLLETEITDNFGRVRRDSIGLTGLGTLLSGESVSFDYTDRLNLVELGSLFNEIDGNPDGAEGYKVSANINELSEGVYSFKFVGEDFSQNTTSNEFVRNFRIDRTAPQLTITQEDNVLTNKPEFSFPVEVTDLSPVTTSLLHNGQKVQDFTGTSFIVSVTLSEGDNIIELVSTDAAQNVSTIFRLNKITLDTIPPVITAFKPVDDSVLRTLDYKVSGNSNEPLSKVIIDEQSEIALVGTSFSVNQMKQAEGEFFVKAQVFDLAGNSTIIEADFQIVLKLIRIELVTLIPENGKILVKGLEGAAKKNLEIEVDGGFFNDKTVMANNDGSFVAALNYSSAFEISASDDELNRSESYTLNFEADTTFSGMIKDVNDNPIPGVLVTIQSSGQQGTTDSNGVFAISDPVTGDQKIKIDGREVSEEYTMSKKKYSYQYFNVSLGNLQRNALERVIYMAPIVLDGTETEVVSGESVIVTSAHAPGVEIEIPADTVVFPEGAEHKISIQEIPADKTSIELLEYSRPDTVYALEPSGLTFKEPVKLTLPNPNGFPVGMEIVIMSKNSESGFWEPGGIAEVVSSDRIETIENAGLEHFSEIYATPYGVQIDPYSPEHKPGIYNEEGALTKSISLPTYKSMGQDIGVNLNYNSFWANPNVFVTNTFNTPTKRIYKKVNESGGGFGTNVRVDGFVSIWHGPESLQSQFTSGSVQTPWLFFDVSNPPEKSTVSYSVDMSELETGVYPAVATYVLQYRYIKVQRIRIRKERTFGGTFTKRLDEDVNELMDAIFPPPLQTNLFVQNKKQSSVGIGWKLGVAEKIHKPDDNKVVVEEASGKLTPYVLKASVENLYTTDRTIESITRNADGDIVVFQDDNKVGRIGENKELIEDGILPYEKISMGVNHYLKAANYDDIIINYQTFERDYRRDGRARWTCWFRKFEGDSKITPTASVFDGNDLFLVDTNHRFYKFNNFTKEIKAGANNTSHAFEYNEHRDKHNSPHGTYHWNHTFDRDVNYFCNQVSETGCGTKLAEGTRNNYTHHSPWTGGSGCTYRKTHLIQKSSIPGTGHVNGAITSSQFNNPTGMIKISPTELLVADRGNNTIRKIDLSSGVTSTFAGNRQTIDSLAGAKENIGIYHPNGIAKDNFGNIYFSSERGYIRKVDPTGVISHIAGSPNGQFQGTAPAKDTFFRDPRGLAIDNDRGLLYVADTGNHRIVQVDLLSGISRSIAGTNVCTSNDIKEGKAALNVSVCSPIHITLDNSGNLVYLDRRNSMVRKIIIDHSENGAQRYGPMNANDNSELIRLADGSFERHFRSGSINYYTKEGFHTSTVDLLGNTTSFTYTDGLLTKVTDAKNKETLIDYIDGQVTSITDPAYRVTRFSYDGEKLERVDYPDGTDESFTYNDKGMITSEINKRGHVARYEYSESDKLNKVIRPDNKEIKIKDGLGESFTSGNYDEDSKIEIADGEEREIEDLYTDAKGFETKVKKDRTGVVTEITDTKDRTSSIERDLDGRPIKITRFDTSYTEFNYNEYGDLTYQFDSDSEEKESFVYNERGQLLKYINSNDDFRTNVYDAEKALLLESVNFNGHKTTRTYYTDGLVESVSNHKNEKTLIFYNDVGNLKKRESPEGEFVEYRRDDAGNIIEKKDQRKIKTLYTYDEFNRLTSVATGVTLADPVGKVTIYVYSESGQLLNITDPNGNLTEFKYDKLDRLIWKKTSLDQVTEMKYDDNSNVSWEKDANGNQKWFEYDSENLLVKKTLPDNLYEMSYDDYGNMLSISDSDSAVEFKYEKIKKEYYVNEVKTSGVEMPEKVLTYGFDKLGNRTSLDSDLGGFSYTYDAQSRLTKVTNHKSEIFDFEFDEVDRLSKITRSGIVTDLSFDQNSFLTSLVHKKGASEINKYLYGRDLAGNRTSITTNKGTITASYDEESQVKTVSNTEAVGSDYASESFNYDDLGNRLNDQLGSSTYDLKSQRLLEDYKNVYLYDLNGNMTSIQEKGLVGNYRNFTYSSENQLVKIEEYKSNNLTKTSEYFFDALGRRMRKKITDHTDALKNFERKYIYDGQEILAELDGSDSTLAVFTHSTLRTDDVLAVDIKSTKMATNTGSYFYLKDGLGSIIDIVDSSGNLVQHYSYSAFGKLLKITDGAGADITAAPSVKTSYTYTNREYDFESGLYHYRARFYIAEVGRFMQEDPDPGRLTHPLTFNSKYIYAGNNPFNNVDPSGESFLKDLITVVAVVAVVYFTGGAAAGAFVKAGAAAGIQSVVIGQIIGGIVGAAVGAAVGGEVGGFVSRAQGQGYRRGANMGRIVGAIVGGYAGGQAGKAQAFQNGVQGAIQTSNGGVLLGCAAAVAAIYVAYKVMTKGSEEILKDKSPPSEGGSSRPEYIQYDEYGDPVGSNSTSGGQQCHTVS